MKKSILFPLCILAGILAFSLWTGTLMQRHTLRWQTQLHTADALAQAETWPEAALALRESYQDWKSQRTWLHILSRHDLVDSAESMYCRAIAFASVRELSELRAELADLDSQLERLRETERFSLNNIL